MSVRLYGQLESDGERLVARVLGHKVGTADGWFHWQGHTIVYPGFTPDEGFTKFFPELLVGERWGVTAPSVLGLMIDYYSGQIALIEMAAKDQIQHVPRVIAQARISA